LEQLLVSISQAGVGECGLDKAINKTVSLDVQNSILKRHMQIAAQHNRPVTMHCVGAWGTLLETIKWHEKESKRTGRSVRAYVLHSCNSMPPEMASSFASIPSVYFSFTARSLGAKETRLARSVPLERILIETDSPDQLPLPLKGRLDSNEPCLIRHSCTLLAKTLEIDPNTLAETTVANAERVFGT
jgi:TatD DNase family protein